MHARAVVTVVESGHVDYNFLAVAVGFAEFVAVDGEDEAAGLVLDGDFFVDIACGVVAGHTTLHDVVLAVGTRAYKHVVVVHILIKQGLELIAGGVCHHGCAGHVVLQRRLLEILLVVARGEDRRGHKHGCAI